jgi:hypothetical protein
LDTGDAYLPALLAVRKGLDAVEAALTALADGTPISRRMLKDLVRDQAPTGDQFEAILTAMISVGLIKTLADGGLAFSRTGFDASIGYRLGLRRGLAAVPAEQSQMLLAALPPPFASDRLPAGVWDLRAALIDLLASAKEHLLLASPFWDDETLDELADLLEEKIRQGVQLDLLGRDLSANTSSGRALSALVTRLGSPRSVRPIVWFYRSDAESSDVQTFHFKCAIVDKGARAYLGSANFTTSGLRSRAELGVLLVPPLSIGLAELVAKLLAMRQS